MLLWVDQKYLLARYSAASGSVDGRSSKSVSTLFVALAQMHTERLSLAVGRYGKVMKLIALVLWERHSEMVSSPALVLGVGVVCQGDVKVRIIFTIPG